MEAWEAMELQDPPHKGNATLIMAPKVYGKWVARANATIFRLYANIGCAELLQPIFAFMRIWVAQALAVTLLHV